VKYFGRNFEKWHSTTATFIVASFFYSAREGELQRSHYNMLRSILYDILAQDEVVFYHLFQVEYREQPYCERGVTWDYESLKNVLRSLPIHPLRRGLYLVIDAVDESEENDRRKILDLLLELCSQRGSNVIKGFVASRPMGQLEIRRNSPQNLIELHKETLPDIRRFTHSLLDGLQLTQILDQATRHIVENAHGVFIWVRLVGQELLLSHEAGYSEEEIFDLLKQLPTELDDFYRRMFEVMEKKKKADVAVGVRMFQFVLFARRPLTVQELLHALGIPDDPGAQFAPSDEDFKKRVPLERRIISCGGNFVEVKRHRGTGMCPQTESSSLRFLH
jgi:hypothetical protein